MTSSKMSSAPLIVVSSRSVSRKPGAGGTTPTFAATGSTITAATRSGWRSNARASASGSL